MQQINNCPTCGSPIAVGQHFCQACGVILGTSCPYCGTAVSPGVGSCSNCGASMGGGTPPQQPAWAPLAPRSLSSPKRLLLMIVLIILLFGIGGIVYWQFGSQSSTANTGQLTISNVAVRYKTETSAQIIWTTDRPASSQVEYGRNPTYGSLVPPQPQDDPTSGASMGVIDHSVILTSLRPGTLYYYRVKSKDAAGNEAVSPGKNFKTVPTVIQQKNLQPTFNIKPEPNNTLLITGLLP